MLLHIGQLSPVLSSVSLSLIHTRVRAGSNEVIVCFLCVRFLFVFFLAIVQPVPQNKSLIWKF